MLNFLNIRTTCKCVGICIFLRFIYYFLSLWCCPCGLTKSSPCRIDSPHSALSALAPSENQTQSLSVSSAVNIYDRFPNLLTRCYTLGIFVFMILKNTQETQDQNRALRFSFLVK